MNLRDEVGQHFFCDQKICYYAVFEGPNRGYVAGGSTQHPLGFQTDRSDAALITLLAQCNDGRLV